MNHGRRKEGVWHKEERQGGWGMGPVMGMKREGQAEQETSEDMTKGVKKDSFNKAALNTE